MCFSGYYLLAAFLAGGAITAMILFAYRAIELSKIEECHILIKIAHKLQKYYWLVKKGKTDEKLKFVIDKTIHTFASKLIQSSPGTANVVLNLFKKDSFGGFAENVSVLYSNYKNQFVAEFSTEYPAEDGLRQINATAIQSISLKQAETTIVEEFQKLLITS